METVRRQIESNAEPKGPEAFKNVIHVFKVKTVGTVVADPDGNDQEILVCNLYSFDGDITGQTDIPVRAASPSGHSVGDKIFAMIPDGGTGLIWADSGTEVQWVEAGAGSDAGASVDIFQDGVLIREDTDYINAVANGPLILTFSAASYDDGTVIHYGVDVSVGITGGSPLQVLQRNAGGLLVFDWVRAH